jgi:hypothetical protein
MRTMREWISLEEDGLAVAWTTRDAPLVHVGGLPLPFAPFPPTVDPEPATVVSWIHNNVWDTNFPSQQGLDRSFPYRVAAAPARRPGDGPVFAHRTAASASRPLLAILARGASARVGVVQAMLEIEDPSVELVDVVPVASGTVLVRLRCLSDGPTTTSVRCNLPVARARRASDLGVAGGDVPVRNGTATIDLAPWATAALLLMLEGTTT